MQRDSVIDLSVVDPKSMMKSVDRSLSSYGYERFFCTKNHGKRKVFELGQFDDSMVDLSKLYIKVKFTAGGQVQRGPRFPGSELSEDVYPISLGWRLIEYINLNYGGVDLPLFDCYWGLMPTMLEVYCKLNGGNCDVVVGDGKVEMSLCLPIKITGYLPMNLPIKLNITFREFPGLDICESDIDIFARRLRLTYPALEMCYNGQTCNNPDEADKKIPNERHQDVVKTSLANYKLRGHKNVAEYLDCRNQDFMMVGIFSKNDMSQTVSMDKLRFSKLGLETHVGPFQLNNLLLNYDNFSKVFGKGMLPVSYDIWKYKMNWFTVIFNPNFDLNEVTVDKCGGKVVLRYDLEGSVIDNEESLDDYEMLVYSSQTNRMLITDYKNVTCYI